MDLLKIPYEHPFTIEWKLKKAELEALKDSIFDDGLFNRQHFPLNIAGIDYSFEILPYGDYDDPETKGKTWIFLHLTIGNVKEVKAKYVISIESANISKNVEVIFKESGASGRMICKSDEFFDPVKMYFINDELIIKIYGNLMFDRRPLIATIPYSLSTKWTIKASQLESLQASNNSGSIKSKEFNIPSNPNIKYYLKLYSNGHGDEEDLRKVTVYLYFKFGNEIRISTCAIFKINSHEIIFGDVYEEETRGYGYEICSMQELFDPKNGYIIDEEMNIDIEGHIFVEKKFQEFLLCIETGTIQYDNKNFVITVDGHEIRVNKDLLANVSTVFDGMMKSGMKETIENRIEITDFPFKTVDSAIKLIQRNLQTFILEDMLPLLVFSDKYDIQIIKDLVEEHLIKKLCTSNVCQLIHFSTIFNASKLFEKSAEFFRQCSHDKAAVNDLDLIEKEMFYKIFYETFPSFP